MRIVLIRLGKHDLLEYSGKRFLALDLLLVVVLLGAEQFAYLFEPGFGLAHLVLGLGVAGFHGSRGLDELLGEVILDFDLVKTAL